MRKGFSLVELSVVLVVIGLLTGGILASQSMIRSAELRGVTAEYRKFMISINTFRDTYGGYPGDLTNATSVWGDNGTACADGAIANGTPGTCNGNGDNIIASPAAANATGENFQLWNQLALAGLLEGNYTGTAGSGGLGHCIPDGNTPSSKMKNAGWYVNVARNFAGDSAAYALDYGNYLMFGAYVLNSWTGSPVLSPGEAAAIDTKIDDGRPAYGTVVARFWNNACAAADDGTSAFNDLEASYRVSENTPLCVLYFRKILGGI